MIPMTCIPRMKRLVIGTVFLLILLSLCTYHWQYCDLHELPENEDVVGSNYTGDRVSLFGVVSGEDNFSIVIEHGSKSRQITVLSSSEVNNGDRVEVLGIMQSANIVDTEEIIVYDKWSYNSIFIRSAFAIPILAVVFFSYWSFSLREFRFRRR